MARVPVGKIVEEEGYHFSDDGTYWIYFKPGWKDIYNDVACIHENTKKEAHQNLRQGYKAGRIRKI